MVLGPNSGDTCGFVQGDWETPRKEAFTYFLGENAETPTMASGHAIQTPDMDNIMNDMLLPPEDMMGL
ncbi:MAG: hypothetical protein AAFP85_18355 [Pseudomonadota bacterium]